MSIIVWVGIAITLATGIPVWLQMRHHPRGLKVLFFAEMWERFSYYGMRGLLIFYLTRHFLLDDAAANSQYGAYTSLVYLLPLIGGVLADRYLGTRKAIVFGAILLVAGHGLMAAEGDPARQYLVHDGARYEVVTGATPRLVVNGAEYAYAPAPGGGLAIQGLPDGAALPQTLAAGSYSTVEERDPFFFSLFYLALAFIIMGVGFLKPNISTIVGQLYEQDDPRRDPGFTLYYYGINLGAFWASVLCGLLGESVGWWAGFGLAGVGMLAGLIVFVRGKASLEGRGEPPDPVRLAAKVLGPLTREHLIYLGGLVGLFFMWALVQRNEAVGLLLIFGSVISLGYVGWYIATQTKGRARFDMLLALILVAGAVVFFTLFEQAGSSLNLFADRNTRLPDGFTAAQTQSFNAGFILIFAPLFAMAWTWLAKRNMDPDPIIKFGLGLLQVGLGFLLLVWAAGSADADYRMPMIFLALAYLLHTTGELCLSPVGLSEITKLSVPALVSTMMAIWFLSSSWAQYLGAFIAEQAGTETIGGQVVDPRAALETSLGVFNAIGWVGVGSGVFFFLLSALLRRRSA
jgi:POT family proton-dependent oligopeptide transporter